MCIRDRYNGSSWTAGGDITNDRRTEADMGTQTAGLIAGGLRNPGPGAVSAEAETYDGSSWTEVNDLNTARTSNEGFGTQTAGISVGGLTGGPNATRVANVEEYNGTSWTEVNDLTAANFNAAGAWGTQTAGGFAGGFPYTNTSFLYDGTNWTASANLNDGRDRAGCSTASPQSSALIFGGNSPGAVTTVEELSGTTSAAEAADISFD